VMVDIMPKDRTAATSRFSLDKPSKRARPNQEIRARGLVEAARAKRFVSDP
jgi:hypothetical protein